MNAAVVVADGMGNLSASLNPHMSDHDKLVVACRSAQMFAKMAGDLLMAQEMEKKSTILVPQVGFRL